jgi:hypothetical protein
MARLSVAKPTQAAPIVAAASQVPVVVFPARRFQLDSVSVETSIELGYAGVVIGRVTVSGDIDDGGLFLPVPDPLPVGTRLNLKINGRAAEARVISVLESADPGKAGMKVRIGAATSAPSADSRAAAADSPAPSAEAVPEAADAQADGGGDGVPSADETGGNSGAVSGGGGRRRRRRR